jgi:hypothetical protein
MKEMKLSFWGLLYQTLLLVEANETYHQNYLQLATKVTKNKFFHQCLKGGTSIQSKRSEQN